ncbi:hypothetical protein GJU40_20105 [Bacillus lacus]|uniref:DUF5348 domain-containing protein n=1 Tax=Metabacillus lacus TaxID=1983721 RepID=A0A7X2M0P2_9BACI|nr:DUF5348 domain-containing protein [Metabacillus lacus]MRX74423.1 hypothetical protein [Metabacillus lacus]
MKARGIMVFDRGEEDWKVWIGQQPYWIEQGYAFELRIGNQYIPALIGKNHAWFVRLGNESYFILDEDEIYKVRIRKEDYIKAVAPY